MRRNLALAALLLTLIFAPAVRAEDPAPDDGSKKADDAPAPARTITPIDKKELKAIDKAFGDYFSEGRPKERLEEVESLIRDLDIKRAEEGLSPILADIDSLVTWVRAKYEFGRLKSGFIEWSKSDNDFGADFDFYINVGKKYRAKDPMSTILLIPDSKLSAKDLKGTLKAITKQKALKDGYLILCPSLPQYPAPVKMPDTDDPEEQAKREAEYADKLAALEETKFQATMAPLNWLMRNANVDPDRLFVVGLGDGASRALRVGTSWTDLLAGVLVQSVAIDGPLKENMGAILAATIEGADDQALGAEIAKHFTADPAPTRNVFRKEITWRFAKPYQQRAFWAQVLVERPDEEKPIGRLDAKIEGNTITITTENIEELRLLLNDRLVDLDQPITVVVNGETQESIQLTRSFRHLIEWIDDHTGDRGYAFTVSTNVRVPEEKKADEGEAAEGAGAKEGEKGDGAEK